MTNRTTTAAAGMLFSHSGEPSIFSQLGKLGPERYMFCLR